MACKFSPAFTVLLKISFQISNHHQYHFLIRVQGESDASN